jgi:hypothetical protein
MLILPQQKEKYLNRRLVDVDKLKKCLITHDFEIAASIGHRLKGNGKTFGHPAIGIIGCSLEEAALLKDQDKLLVATSNLLLAIEEQLRNIHSDNFNKVIKL